MNPCSEGCGRDKRSTLAFQGRKTKPSQLLAFAYALGVTIEDLYRSEGWKYVTPTGDEVALIKRASARKIADRLHDDLADLGTVLDETRTVFRDLVNKQRAVSDEFEGELVELSRDLHDTRNRVVRNLRQAELKEK